MSLLLVSPDYQQPLYWECRKNGHLPFTRTGGGLRIPVWSQYWHMINTTNRALMNTALEELSWLKVTRVKLIKKNNTTITLNENNRQYLLVMNKNRCTLDFYIFHIPNVVAICKHCMCVFAMSNKWYPIQQIHCDSLQHIYHSDSVLVDIIIHLCLYSGCEVRTVSNVAKRW